ncbi:MAG: DUF1329 domain-containing protein [Pseudomonadota bacterium]
MKNNMLTAGILTLSFLAFPIAAKVTAEQAEQLGTTLTPLGAEQAGNAAGTIPPWTGGLTSENTPESADSGRPDNPFPDDEPLFTITTENLDQYKDNLSPGQIAMFNKYPGYKMPVYQTRRTAAYSQDLYDIVKKNATNAELIEGGLGLKNFDTTIPFPIPENATEVIWNHITRFRGGTGERSITAIPVQADGSYVPIKMKESLAWPEFLTTGRDAEKDDNVLFYYLQIITAPARLTGTALLVHETIDQVKEPRRAWIYNSGQRRVRRAPNVAYDGPAVGTDGLRTADNFDMYNGAPDRYNWELKGKKEMYIPYNSYKLMDTDAKYEDIVQRGHLNGDFLRYELHRVWVVEATLKDGARHIYDKRVIHINEDTWNAAVIDHYDGQGELWRVAEAHLIQFHDINTPWMVAEALHDLNSGRYLVTGLSNEEPRFLRWEIDAKRRDFSTSALRRVGR